MLLAKASSKGFVGTSLVQHTRDVVEAAETLLMERSSILGAMGIAWGTRGVDLYDAVSLACFLHDIGKANDFFQDMLAGRQNDNCQPITHEIVSGVMALQPEFKAWLKSGGISDKVFNYAVAAALGHHRRWDANTKQTDLPVDMTIDRSHEDVVSVMSMIGERLGIEAEPMSVLRIHATPDGRRLAYGGVLARMKRDLREWFGENVDDAEDRKVLAAAKALTIAADVCASAIRGRFHRQSNDEFIAGFTRNLLDEGLTEDELRKIIAKWAYDVTPGEKPPKNWNKKSLPKSFRFRPFQEEVANSPSKITLAQAGCGSGKSIASYLWAQRLLKDYGQKKLRMIFTLPTTGTSTEHYRDYALESGLDGRLTALSHSRAVVDLAYDEKGAEAMLEHRARIESLELWGTQITICTVDTVLGLMANQRKAIYSFPAIMKSAIVFDEIHAYDDVMFGHLLVFIKNFTGIPMLLMTASLPEERLEAIRDVRPDLHVVHGDPSYEEAKRYAKFELTRPVSDGKMHIVEDRIREYIDLYPNAKILWVRNQVKWANETYQACLRLFGDIADVDLYHSRYRYKDRTRIHSRVIQRFKTSPRPSILVATQVAEMSLNLSAHLLVTDVCEIPGVIQRMGRCNRGASPLPAPAGHTIVCCLPSYDKNKMNCYPYKEQQVNDCVRWAQELQHVGPLSQKDLADAFERYRAPAAVNLQDAECNAVFFKQTWETTIGAARDPNPTVTILLENDYDAFIASGEAGGRQDRIRMWLREHETNVVSRAAVNGWRRYKGVPVAPSNEIIYGEIDDPQPERRTGAEWAV